MRIVRTEIFRATTPAGEAVLRVRFCGAGGNCVAVDMAPSEGGTEEAALDRARAILVRTATLSLAANDYDAISNGNFDEVDVTAANDDNRAVYIFEYRDGADSRQVPPAAMPNFEAARREAIRRAVDVLAGLEPGGDAPTGWLVRLRDGEGGLLCVVDAQEAEAARQARR